MLECHEWMFFQVAYVGPTLWLRTWKSRFETLTDGSCCVLLLARLRCSSDVFLSRHEDENTFCRLRHRDLLKLFVAPNTQSNTRLINLANIFRHKISIVVFILLHPWPVPFVFNVRFQWQCLDIVRSLNHFRTHLGCLISSAVAENHNPKNLVMMINIFFKYDGKVRW